MANQKISELTTLTGADVQPTSDLIPIVDNSATETKKITPEQLLIGMGVSATAAELNQLEDNTFDTQVNAPSIIISGTNGNGHADLKWQASDPNGHGNHTAVWADSDGDLSFKKDGGTTKVVATADQLTNLFNKSSDDTDDISVGTTNKFATAAEKTKLGYISVTQAVDLDAIESRVNELDASVILKGTWDASAGTFPASGLAQAGWSYIVTVAGTVDGIAFSINDRLLAITDNASASTYANNWLKLDYTDQVLSVNGSTGAVTVTPNATHTGEVTGSGALTVDKTAITNKTEVTAVSGDYILISDTSDSGNLKKALASDFMSGSGGVEVLTSTATGVQTNLSTSAATSKNTISILRWTPTSMAILQSINTTGWEDGKIIRIMNRTLNGSTGRLILIENNNGASGTKMNYVKNGVPLMLFPGDHADFSFNSGASTLNFIGGSSFGTNPRQSFTMYDDFVAGPNVSSGGAIAMMGSFVGIQNGGASGTHTTSFQASTVNAHGVVDLSTLTSASSQFILGTSLQTAMVGGNGCALSLVRMTPLTALSDGTERYQLYAGFQDGFFGPMNDGVYWKYDDSAASVWRTATISNSSENVSDASGFTVSISTMPYLGIFINGNWSNVQYFYSVDGTTWTISNVLTDTSKIPTTTSRTFAFGGSIRKSIGTTARVASIDLMGYRYDFSRGT